MRFLANFVADTFEFWFFFTNFTEIVNTSPHEVPDRNIFGKHIFSGGAGGGQRPAQKGDAGTQVLCHEVPGWLCSLYRIPLKNTSLLVVLGMAKSASTGMRGHKSYVMIFLSDLVLETCETTWVCWPAKLSSKKKEKPFWCSWKLLFSKRLINMGWLVVLAGAKNRTTITNENGEGHREREGHNGLINR